jgi:hypothetical protein
MAERGLTPIHSRGQTPAGGLTPLDGQAADNLRFIRDAMASAAGFTAVPGWGGVMMGVTAVVTAAISGPPAAGSAWLRWWLADAVIAATIGLVAIVLKARRTATSLGGPGARRFALAFVPALVAGAVLTFVFARRGLTDLLPGTWLVLYGAAVCSGGAFSVRVVPMIGATHMGIGAAAFVVPARWGHIVLGIGFGVLHIVFGIIIARKHGG